MNSLTARLGLLSRRIRTGFYLCLFFLFSVSSGALLHLKFDLLDFESLQYDEGALDTAFNWRLRAPAADPRFLIVEIDEASLEHFAEAHGRWPWPRYVFAEALAGISSYGPKSITFNIMFSDPDKKDPDSDALFNYIIEEVDNVIFPATRLSKNNDEISEVKASQLSFARDISEDRTLAILVTMFEAAEEKMGINNLLIDDDGIVRRFASLHSEPGFSLETIPAKIAAIESRTVKDTEYLINWPEDIESYESMSFKVLYEELENGDELALNRLSDKHVLFGLTAQGLSFQRPTPLSAFTEDTRILAAVADNTIQGKGLRTIPPVLILLFSILMFGTLSLCFILKIDDGLIDTIFIGLETSSLLITVGSISYTSYAVDLSFLVLSGLIYFAICKTYDIPVRSSERAYRSFFDGKISQKYSCFSVFIFQSGELDKLLERLQISSPANERIFLVDNFISSQSLFQEEIVESEVLVFLHSEMLTDPELTDEFSSALNYSIGNNFQSDALRVIVRLYSQILGPVSNEN